MTAPQTPNKKGDFIFSAIATFVVMVVVGALNSFMELGMDTFKLYVFSGIMVLLVLIAPACHRYLSKTK